MLAFITAFSCISSFLFGYDLGLMVRMHTLPHSLSTCLTPHPWQQGGALLHIQEEFNTSEGVSEVIVGAAKLGAVLGTFLGGALMLYYGRRPAIAADSLFFIIGPILMGVAWSVTALIIGRFIVGIGIGISAVVVPAYLGEVAPARARGRVVELYEVMLCLGMLTSALIDAALDDVTGNWRWMVGAPAIPAIIMCLAVCILPESPRWLVVQGRLDEALAVIHKVHTNQLLPVGAQFSTAEVEGELMELWSSVEKDKAAAAQRAGAAENALRRRRWEREKHRIQRKKQPQQQQQQQQQLLNGSDRQRAGEEEGGGGSSDETERLRAGLVGRSDEEVGVTVSNNVSAFFPPPLPPSATTTVTTTAHTNLMTTSRSSPGGGSGHISRRSSSTASECLSPVDDSIVLPIPHHLPRIRTRSNDRLYEMAEEAIAAVDGGGGGGGGGNNNPNPSHHMSGPAVTELSSLTAHGKSTISLHRHSASGSLSSMPHTPSDLPPAPLELLASSGPPSDDPSVGGGSGGCGGNTTTNDNNSNNSIVHKQGFWATAWHMMKDITLIARGPESSAFILIIVLAFFNQAFASTAIINYAPSVLQHAGVESTATASLFTSLIGGCKLAGVIIAFFLIDSVGRRPLLVWGSIGCCASLLLLIPADLTDSHWLLILGMCSFIFSFSVSWAGVFWVLLSECFSMAAKSPAASAATAVLFLTGAVADLLFLSYHSWMGAFSFLLYACIAAAAALYVIMVVPETKGRTLQEVQDMLALGKKHPSDYGRERGLEMEMGGGLAVSGRRSWPWSRHRHPN